LPQKTRIQFSGVKRTSAGAPENRIFRFLDILRDAGISISTDEVLTVFRSLKYVDASDKTIFRHSLRTTLVKDFTDIPVFNRCFDEFFHGRIADPSADAAPSGELAPEEMKRLEDKLEQFLDEIIENNIFEKDPEKLLSIFLDELEEAESGGGAAGLNIFLNKRSEVQTTYSSESRAEDSDEEITARLLNIIRKRQAEDKIGTEVKKREDYLLNKYIYQLKPEEIKEMREVVRRFGQKLKNRISLRKKRVKHGGIDIKRTLRASLKFDGIPFRISYKNKKIDRPQLVVLCDISGSVNQYTRFMLLLTHTLQSLFSKVRTFAFISNMVEITPLFMEMDPIEAINSIFSDTNFTYGWGSNYGRCFNQFVKEYGDSLNRKTTVLVLGDARNNNQDPGMNSFIQIRERTRNLFWLNPDRKHLWDWNDSIATTYLGYCTEMKEVNSFLDLTDFIDRLFRK
jgi:hypothetical protein